MDNFSFNYDTDSLDLVELNEKYKITRKEIIAVFENLKKLTEVFEENTSIFIGAGYNKLRERILLIAFILVGDGSDIQFIGAKLLSEEEIDKFYCG